MPINSVILANTFNEFRTTVNEIITTVNAVSGGSGVINANSLIGGTVTANNLTSGRITLATTAGQLTDDSALTYDTSTDILTLAGTTDASSSTTGTLKVAGGVGIAKKLYVGTDLAVTGTASFSGNVFFLGSNTEVSTTQLNVNDSLLQLANNNTADVVDIGVFGQYNSGAGNVHSGIFRDASDDTWKLFRKYNVEPGTTIDPAANGFEFANLRLNNLEANNITANTFSGSGASLTALNATQLTTGTVPDGRFPATLPASSGVNLTALNATQLTSGTVPDARFPATLPASSGANLTALNATQLTSGTVPDARFPATLPAASGANLTALNASNLSTGTVATARLATSGTASSSTFLRGDQVWASAAVSIIDDTATNSTFFPVFTSVTSGSIVGANTSSTKLTFNPSSGLLTSTDYNSSSDVTLKENFTQIVNPLDIISQLEGFGFSWKDTKEKSYGLSAQQVETVLPEIVRVRPDGTKGINYLNLIAFLVEGIKDLKEEVRQLKSYK